MKQEEQEEQEQNKLLQFICSDKIYIIIAALLCSMFIFYLFITKSFSADTNIMINNENVVQNITSEYSKGHIYLIMKLNEPKVEDWHAEFVEGNIDTVQRSIILTSLDSSSKIVNIPCVLLKVSTEDPITLKFTILDVNAFDFYKLKRNFSTMNLKLLLPNILINSPNTQLSAYNDYNNWKKEQERLQKEAEFENQINFTNIGDQNVTVSCLDSSFEVIDIKKDDILTRGSETIYPRHAYFVTIYFREWNNSSYSQHIGHNEYSSEPWFNGSLYDNQFNYYREFGTNLNPDAVHPGESGTGTLFFDVPLNQPYFLKYSATSFGGVYIDPLKKVYCVNSSDDLITNVNACTKYLRSMYPQEYKKNLAEYSQKQQEEQDKLNKTQEQASKIDNTLKLFN